MAPNPVPRAGRHFLCPLSGWWQNSRRSEALMPGGWDACSPLLRIKLHCPSFSFQIPQPQGQPSTLRETKTWMSQDIPSLPTHPSRDQNQPTPAPSTLVTPPSCHPPGEPHPALPSRVHLPCCSSEAPTLSAALRSTLVPSTKITLAPGKHLQFSGDRQVRTGFYSTDF